MNHEQCYYSSFNIEGHQLQLINIYRTRNTSLESKIIPRDGKAYINCLVRDKEIQLKPEEVIRQLYASKLINAYAYPKKRIRFEHPVSFGREVKSV
ncbi:type I restriction enzyme HsdR N-terminal domain-containing protein [Chloroflexota bacterium]